MQITMQVFILAAAIALLVQTTILIVLFLQLKKTTESVNRMVGDLHSRVGPILTRTQIMLDDTQPKISALVEDAAHIVYMTQDCHGSFGSVARPVGGCGPHSDRDAGSGGRCGFAGAEEFLGAGAEGFGNCAGNQNWTRRVAFAEG